MKRPGRQCQTARFALRYGSFGCVKRVVSHCRQGRFSEPGRPLRPARRQPSAPLGPVSVICMGLRGHEAQPRRPASGRFPLYLATFARHDFKSSGDTLCYISFANVNFISQIQAAFPACQPMSCPPAAGRRIQRRNMAPWQESGRRTPKGQYRYHENGCHAQWHRTCGTSSTMAFRSRRDKNNIHVLQG